MVFVSWGGTTQDAQKANWADSFTNNTSIAVVQDGPTDYGKIKAMVEAGSVTWDVVDVEGDYAVQAGKAGTPRAGARQLEGFQLVADGTQVLAVELGRLAEDAAAFGPGVGVKRQLNQSLGLGDRFRRRAA